MTVTKLAAVAALIAATVSLGACANTIRGAGQDTANVVNATQSAGNNVGNAARR